MREYDTSLVSDAGLLFLYGFMAGMSTTVLLFFVMNEVGVI